MSFGLNSDLRVGDQVYHIQTEARGPERVVIDTVVYWRGRVVHRRAVDSADSTGGVRISEVALRNRIEEQHRAVIEELRSGAISLDLTDATLATPGIEVRLLNPTAWFAAGNVALELEVVNNLDALPLADAQVVVRLDGADGPLHYSGASDARGRLQVSFPMPRVAPNGAEMVIRAVAPPGEHEIRYLLKPKAKPPAS